MGYEDPSISQLKKAFNHIDKNGNGKLNEHEIKEFLKNTQDDDFTTEEQIKAMIDKHDTVHKDGTLNFEEFCNAAEDIMPPITEAFKKAVDKL